MDNLRFRSYASCILRSFNFAVFQLNVSRQAEETGVERGLGVQRNVCGLWGSRVLRELLIELSCK
jgi:hypothetical protein